MLLILVIQVLITTGYLPVFQSRILTFILKADPGLKFHCQYFDVIYLVTETGITVSSLLWH